MQDIYSYSKNVIARMGVVLQELNRFGHCVITGIALMLPTIKRRSPLCPKTNYRNYIIQPRRSYRSPKSKNIDKMLEMGGNALMVIRNERFARYLGGGGF